MSEDGSPRGAQIAMLGVAAATLILSDPSERSQRLADAGHEIARWPADGARLEEKLEADCDGGTFNLPAKLDLGWYDDNLVDVSECRDRLAHAADAGAGIDPLCAQSDPGPGAEASASGPGVDGGGRRGVVAVRGYRLLARASAGAGCSGLAARRPEALDGGTEDGNPVSMCDVLPPSDSAGCKPENWWIAGTVARAPAEGPLEAAARAARVQREAAIRVRVTNDEVDKAKGALLEKSRDYGTRGADAERQTLAERLAESSDAGVVATAADTTYQGALTALRGSSAAARDALPAPGTPYVLVANPIVPFWFIAHGNDERPGRCVAPCEGGAHGESADLPDLDACISTLDVEVAPGESSFAGDVWTSCAAAPLRPTQLLDVGLLAQAGVWSDLREDDPLSAEAKLKDLEAKAALEGEVFGLKLESRDAVRWAWLPVTALEAYAARLLLGQKESPDPADLWTRPAWQIGLGLCAIAVVAFSVVRGLDADVAASWQYGCAVLVLLPLAVLVVLMALVRRVLHRGTRAPDLP